MQVVLVDLLATRRDGHSQTSPQLVKSSAV
jgi:hypothetical protein